MTRALRLATLAALCLGASWPAAAHAVPATRDIRLGPATLTVPAAWRPVARHAATATIALGSGRRATIAVGPPIDRTLVPAALRNLAGDAAPHRARLAGYAAWRYADVTVLPSGAGVLAVACRGCGSAVTRVSFAGAAVLVPAPDLAFRVRLPGVLGRLDAARRRGRLLLHRAGSPAAQAAAARTLSAAHVQAARALRPFSGTAQRPLLAALTGAAGAYRTLAAGAGSGRPERAARRQVSRSEARLAAAVTGAVRADRFRAAPTPPQATVGSGPRGILLGLAAVLFAGAVLLLRRRRPAPALAAPAIEVARPRIRRTYAPPARPAPPPPGPSAPSRGHETRWDAHAV